MSLPSLSVLDKHRRAGQFPAAYPSKLRLFYEGADDVRGVLAELAASAATSLVVGMVELDDQLAGVLRAKLADEQVFVQLTLDSCQASSAQGKVLSAAAGYPAASVRSGRPEPGAVCLRMVVVDGIDVVSGTGPDGILTVVRDPYVAIEARARLDAIHASMTVRHY